MKKKAQIFWIIMIKCMHTNKYLNAYMLKCFKKLIFNNNLILFGHFGCRFHHLNLENVPFNYLVCVQCGRFFALTSTTKAFTKRLVVQCSYFTALFNIIQTFLHSNIWLIIFVFCLFVRFFGVLAFLQSPLYYIL